MKWSRLLPRSLRTLTSGSLAGPVLTLVTGTVVAQGLAYLARPLLTRLFTPEAFGLLGFYLAAVMVLSTVASGKYEDAILLPGEQRDAAHVYALTLGLGLAAFALSLLILPFRDALAAGLGRPEVVEVLVFVPAGLLATAWGRAAELWLTRADRFKTISGARIAQNGAMLPIQIGSGLQGIGAAGLVGGHVLGRIVGTAVTLMRGGLGVRPRLSELRAAARRYRRFPQFALPSGFLNTLSTQLPAFLLFVFFAPDVLGFYALAYGTLAVPMQLLGGSVGQVYFARAAEASRSGGLGDLTQTVFSRLSAIGLFPLAALALAAPAAFSVVFGAEWREAGTYAQLMAPWLYFVFVSAPLSNLFDVFERQHLELAFNAAMVLARAAALVVGGWLGDPLWAIGLYAAVSTALWLGHTAWMLNWGEVRTGEAARTLARHALRAALPLALVAVAVALGWSDFAVTAVLVVAGLGWLATLVRAEPGLLQRPTP